MQPVLSFKRLAIYLIFIVITKKKFLIIKKNILLGIIKYIISLKEVYYYLLRGVLLVKKSILRDKIFFFNCQFNSISNLRVLGLKFRRAVLQALHLIRIF